MTKQGLELFAKDLTGESMQLYKLVKDGKWYDKEYSKDFTTIETESTYGIYIDGLHYFDFKTGKNEDNILKTFVTQYINKHAVKKQSWVNGELIRPTKEQVIYKLKKESRVSKYYFYTTLYGIGWFCFLTGEKQFNSINKTMATYLKSNGISYSNEFSEAGWVYRFVIKQAVEIHDNLLRDMQI